MDEEERTIKIDDSVDTSLSSDGIALFVSGIQNDIVVS